MKLEVRGYARDCGWTVIANSDVSEIRLPSLKSWQRSASGGAKLMKTKEGVTIRKSPARLTLNGRYIVDVELTNEEIRNLYLEAFADEPLSQAISR